MTGWAEKYRPKTLDEIAGNPTAGAERLKRAAAWDKGRPDKRAAIVEMIQETRQPVVLIANDYYALTRRSSSLKRLCKTIKFQGVHEDAMKNILRTIASKEGVDVADDVLEVIVERAGGDLRSAINDLESLAVGRRTIVAEATRALGYRDRARTIFPVLEEILRSGDARRARDAVREEPGEDVACFSVDRPPGSLADDRAFVLGGGGTADPPPRRARPRRTGGGLPPRRVGDEPRREASSREGGENQSPADRRTGTRSAFLLRGGRCGLRAESGNGGSSTGASSSRTRSGTCATCSRSSIEGGAFRSSLWIWV